MGKKSVFLGLVLGLFFVFSAVCLAGGMGGSGGATSGSSSPTTVFSRSNSMAASLAGNWQITLIGQYRTSDGERGWTYDRGYIAIGMAECDDKWGHCNADTAMYDDPAMQQWAGYFHVSFNQNDNQVWMSFSICDLIASGNDAGSEWTFNECHYFDFPFFYIPNEKLDGGFQGGVYQSFSSDDDYWSQTIERQWGNFTLKKLPAVRSRARGDRG